MIAESFIQSLPAWTHVRFSGQAVWQWFGLALAALLGTIVMAFTFTTYRKAKGPASLLLPIVGMSMPGLVVYLASEQLAIRGVTFEVLEVSTDVVFLLASLFVIVNLGHRIGEFIVSSPRINPKGIDAQFVQLICRFAGHVGAVVVLLEGGKYLGIPLTTLVAGAGISGLVIALAAQDALKNLFGSIMIFLDKPYRVGERIVAYEYDGTVEEIGLRSTKLRLLNGHEVCIPNEQMAGKDIVNISRCPHIIQKMDIRIRLDTPSHKIARALEICSNALENHEGMNVNDPPRVYMNKINADSLNINICYWYYPPDFWKQQSFNENLNRTILEKYRAEGIALALPAINHFAEPNPDQRLLRKA